MTLPDQPEEKESRGEPRKERLIPAPPSELLEKHGLLLKKKQEKRKQELGEIFFDKNTGRRIHVCVMCHQYGENWTYLPKRGYMCDDCLEDFYGVGETFTDM